MAHEYPVYQQRLSRRTTVSVLVVGAVVAFELVLQVVRRRWPMAHVWLRSATVALWAIVGVVLLTTFVRSWDVLALLIEVQRRL